MNLVLLLLLVLPGTEPLRFEGDPAEAMVERIKRYLVRLTEEPRPARNPTRERLRQVLGVVDARVPFDAPETISGATVRWPVLDGVWAEGVLLKPAGEPRGFIVAVPDADDAPEQFAAAQRFAAAGFVVLSPALINRDDKYSGKPAVRLTNQSHREWIYRMAYPFGRHVIGFEVQKILAAVDWFEKQAGARPISVYGYGEGGGLALFAAAVDERIAIAGVSGFSVDRTGAWREPIYRNVWSLLKDFSDGGIVSLIAPRILILDKVPGPAVASRPEPAAPGALEAVIAGDTTNDAVSQMIGTDTADFEPIVLAALGSDARQRRMILEIERFLDRLTPVTEKTRAALWAREGPKGVRTRLRHDLIGELPVDDTPLRPRTREITGGYEVMLDVAPGVFAYGVLLLPRNQRPGERRPAVVMQHGLDGRPQSLYGQTSGRAFDVYGNIGQRLADAGFVVYMPQNPYIADFRPISRLANPLGLTLFSVILRQHSRMLDWLSAQPFVDPGRIGFYGLSYGGKTALRVPPLEDRYALSICSADFNEWVRKLTNVAEPWSYMFTKEYEILEFDLAGIANHAEMAMLMAPRPFMVERGHRDTVAIDEWVAYEYAKVRRFYAQSEIESKTAIAWFDGPHRIDGAATIQFLKDHLRP